MSGERHGGDLLNHAKVVVRLSLNKGGRNSIQVSQVSHGQESNQLSPHLLPVAQSWSQEWNQHWTQ